MFQTHAPVLLIALLAARLWAMKAAAAWAAPGRTGSRLVCIKPLPVKGMARVCVCVVCVCARVRAMFPNFAMKCEAKRRLRGLVTSACMIHVGRSRAWSQIIHHSFFDRQPDHSLCLPPTCVDVLLDGAWSQFIHHTFLDGQPDHSLCLPPTCVDVLLDGAWSQIIHHTFLDGQPDHFTASPSNMC
eukprot:1152238-Pelagomonas_calceolata.AAC.4